MLAPLQRLWSKAADSASRLRSAAASRIATEAPPTDRAGADGDIGGRATTTAPAVTSRPSAGADAAGSAAAGHPPGTAAVPPPLEPPTRHPHAVPPGLRTASDWAWRLLVLTTAVVLGLWLLVKLRLIVFPVIVALFVCAILATPVRRLTDRGMPRGWATFTVMLASIIGVITVLILVGSAIAAGVRDVGVSATEGVDEIRDWLINGPLKLNETDIKQFQDDIGQAISNNRERIAAGALQSATLLVEVLAGGILALLVTVILLYDGPRIWRWCVGLFPRRTAPHLDEAGRRAWTALSGYVRGTVAVAFVDGFFITLWLLILRVPLAIPLGVVVFFGGFVPLVGATVSGVLAVLVALVTKGFITALLTTAGIIMVQQLEGHILQPLLMGRFVRIHPLAIILAIGAGGILAGIGGAIIAVPIVAVVNTVVKYWAENARAGLPDWPPPPGSEEPESDGPSGPGPPNESELPDGPELPNEPEPAVEPESRGGPERRPPPPPEPGSAPDQLQPSAVVDTEPGPDQ
jgi:predicted PurR-regulated permease PerM